MKKVEFFKHNLTDRDRKECMKVLTSTFLTTGQVVKTFEEKFSKYVGIKHVVGVTSCTDALFLALKCIGVGQGDEVITTSMSFIATANVIEYCGAKTVFVDCEANTGNIDANNIEKAITPKTKAIIVVHLYGQMADMKAIRKIADKYKLKVIEDAAHCIEGSRDNISVGEFGDIACFSFYATKTITSGEGGAVATNNEKYYSWLYKARLHGMSKNALDRYTKKYEHYDIDFLGYKANMTNIQASLLLHQVDRINTYLSQRTIIAEKYTKAFLTNSYVSIPTTLLHVKHARYIYTIWVNPRKRDEYLSLLQQANIGIAVNFDPIHLMKYYKDKYGFKRGDFPNTEKIGSSTITIPLYPKLTQKEIQYVIKTINRIITS